MSALHLTFTLESPLLMTGVANAEPNSSQTLTYIPGSAIRGAYIAAWIRKHRPHDLLADAQARTLFFSDRVRFLNGYLVYNNERGLPTPASWRGDKEQMDWKKYPRRSLFDFAAQVQDDDTSWKLERTPFFWRDGERDVYLAGPSEITTVHNASDDPLRKGAGVSTVFRYNALAAGQRFRAVIESDDVALLDGLAELLSGGHLRLGGSQSASYGRVGLAVTKAPFREYTMQAPEGVIMLTFLSHVLLRTSSGLPSVNFAAWLAEQAGNRDVKPQAVFGGTALVGGFNRKWGLPLPQQQALAMGTTYVYAADAFDVGQLQSFVQAGIGERRNEGFGRVAVNLWETEEFTAQKADFEGSSRLRTPSAAALPLALQMFERALYQQAEAQMLAEVEQALPEGGRRASDPDETSLTAFNGLRQVVKDAQRVDDPSRILTHLDHLKTLGRTAFDERLGNQRWEQWIRARVNDMDVLATLDVKVVELARKWLGAEASPPDAVVSRVSRAITFGWLDAALRRVIRQKQAQQKKGEASYG